MSQQQQIHDFLATERREFESFIDRLNCQEIENAAAMILASENQGGRLHVTGIGKPAHLGGYIASLLSSTGTPAYWLDGTEAVHGSCGQVREGDVVIAISNSGQTEELQRTVRALQANGARVIGVCANPQSWLGEHADALIIAGVQQEGDILNKPPRASILVEMAALQALSILLQNEKQLTIEQYEKWHPGGSLGAACRKESGHESV